MLKKKTFIGIFCLILIAAAVVFYLQDKKNNPVKQQEATAQIQEKQITEKTVKTPVSTEAKPATTESQSSKPETKPATTESQSSKPETKPATTESQSAKPETKPGKIESKANEPNLDELIAQSEIVKDEKTVAEKKENSQSKVEISPETVKETKQEKQEVAEKKVVKKTINYENFTSPYVSFKFDRDTWEYADAKSMDFPDNIIFPKMNPLLMAQFYKKPYYNSSVVLYVANADSMSDFSKMGKKETPEDYVKYLFQKYNIKSIKNLKISGQKFVITDIALAGKDNTNQYFITSKDGFLFILITTEKDKVHEEMIVNIIKSNF